MTAPSPTEDTVTLKSTASSGQAFWRIWIENESARLADLLAATGTPATDSVHNSVHASIEKALEAARWGENSRGERLRNWWNGSAVETAWRALHRAGESLLLIMKEADLRAQLPDLKAAVFQNLPRGDPRRVAYETQLRKIEEPGSTIERAERLQLREMRRQTNVVSDGAYVNVRAFRNARVVAVSLLAVVLILVGLIHVLNPNFATLCAHPTARLTRLAEPCPQGSSPARGDVFSVELLGALGGLLSALASLSRIRAAGPPYILPRVMRVVSGAGTGLLGVLLLQGGFFGSLAPQPGPSVYAYAIVFGLAQDPVMRGVERKAQDILTTATSYEDPARPTVTETPA